MLVVEDWIAALEAKLNQLARLYVMGRATQRLSGRTPLTSRNWST